MRKAHSLFILIIFCFTLIAYFKSFTLDFYNDDYQIIGYLQDNFASQPLKVVASKDVSSYYYRPVPNLLNTIVLNIFGFKPLPFRIFNFLLYISFIMLFYFFLEKLFQSRLLAFILALLFSLLPSHDLFLVWIASIGDLLAASFILASFYCLLFCKTKFRFFLSLLWFTLSFLSKESTILAPFLAFSLSFVLVSDKKIWQRYFFFTIAIVLLLMTFRHFVLGIDIFSSPNLANSSFLQSLANFFIYPFVVAIPGFAFQPQNLLGILMNSIILITVASLVMLYVFRNEDKKQSNILFGLFWYFWFVLPALPLFMRWYSFLPSIGLFIALAELLRKIKTKYLLMFSIPFVAIFFVTNYYSIAGWKKSNVVAHDVLSETAKIDVSSSRKVLLWFFPQYYYNYPILRSGVQQAVNFSRSIKFDEVLLPVSIVMTPRTSVHLVRKGENRFLFEVDGASVFFKSRNEDIPEGFTLANDYYTLQVQDKTADYCILEVEFIRPKPEYRNYYFDGKKFVEFGDVLESNIPLLGDKNGI